MNKPLLNSSAIIIKIRRTYDSTATTTCCVLFGRRSYGKAKLKVFKITSNDNSINSKYIL
jgi:hypothetical protein